MSDARTSTVPVAIRALHDLLADQQWPDRPNGVPGDVLVDHTSKLRDNSREQVLIGAVVGDQEYTALGARSRDEDYSVSLYVVVRWPGDRPIDAMERAWQIFGVIETLLTSPEFLALGQEQGVLWNEIKRPEGTPTTEGEGVGYVIASAVRFRSRLRPRDC